MPEKLQNNVTGLEIRSKRVVVIEAWESSVDVIYFCRTFKLWLVQSEKEKLPVQHHVVWGEAVRHAKTKQSSFQPKRKPFGLACQTTSEPALFLHSQTPFFESIKLT